MKTQTQTQTLSLTLAALLITSSAQSGSTAETSVCLSRTENGNSYNTAVASFENVQNPIFVLRSYSSGGCSASEKCYINSGDVFEVRPVPESDVDAHSGNVQTLPADQALETGQAAPIGIELFWRNQNQAPVKIPVHVTTSFGVQYLKSDPIDVGHHTKILAYLLYSGKSDCPSMGAYAGKVCRYYVIETFPEQENEAMYVRPDSKSAQWSKIPCRTSEELGGSGGIEIPPRVGG